MAETFKDLLSAPLDFLLGMVETYILDSCRKKVFETSSLIREGKFSVMQKNGKNISKY